MPPGLVDALEVTNFTEKNVAAGVLGRGLISRRTRRGVASRNGRAERVAADVAHRKARGQRGDDSGRTRDSNHCRRVAGGDDQ